MAVKVNRRRTYEAKCVYRLKALAESKGIQVHCTRWGTLGMDRSCCVLIEPGVPAEKGPGAVPGGPKVFPQGLC